MHISFPEYSYVFVCFVTVRLNMFERATNILKFNSDIMSHCNLNEITYAIAYIYARIYIHVYMHASYKYLRASLHVYCASHMLTIIYM
jgi:accessory gene regulator protein AgrB